MAACEHKTRAIRTATALFDGTPGLSTVDCICHCSACNLDRTGAPIGGFPTVNPSGWAEFGCGLNSAQKAIVAAGTHPIAYHGTTVARAKGLLNTPNGAPQLCPPQAVRPDGSQPPPDPHHIQRSFNRTNQNDHREELFNAPACVFGSPDPVYAELYCRDEEHTVDGQKMALKVALKLRFAPTTFGVGQHTLTKQLEDKLKSICAVDINALEYYTNRLGVVFVEAVMIRVKPPNAEWPSKLPRIPGTPSLTVPHGCLVYPRDPTRADTPPETPGDDNHMIALQQLAGLAVARAAKPAVTQTVTRTVTKRGFSSIFKKKMRETVTTTVVEAGNASLTAGAASGGLGFAINLAIDGVNTYNSTDPDKYEKLLEKTKQENLPGAAVDFVCTAAAGALLGAATWPGFVVGVGARVAVNLAIGL